MSLTTVITSVIIFGLTLLLVIWQPKGLGIGFSAIGGALLALATGVVQLENIPEVWGIVWNATFTLVGMIIFSLLLDEAGFFRWMALHVARWGWGYGRLLFPLLVLFGALVSGVFTNDGVVLILTPIVMEMLRVLEFGPEATLAFVMATGFIADATSLPFPVSNLVNIISTDYFDISFGRYALVMIPVNFIAIASSLAVLWFYFERKIPQRYELTHLAQPDSVIRDPVVFRWGFVVLGLVLVGYFVAEPLGIPISFIVGSGVLILLVLSRWGRPQDLPPVISIRKILAEAPWQVVLFSLGMYLVVIGLRNAGLTDLLSLGMQGLSQWGLVLATLGTGFIATFLSSIMNNLPSVLINALAIQSAAIADPMVQEAMVYANVIGCNLGTKITPIGSLATLIWLHILARRGLRITWKQYFQVGIVLTLPVLFITLLGLALWLPWVTA